MLHRVGVYLPPTIFYPLFIDDAVEGVFLLGTFFFSDVVAFPPLR